MSARRVDSRSQGVNSMLASSTCNHIVQSTVIPTSPGYKQQFAKPACTGTLIPYITGKNEFVIIIAGVGVSSALIIAVCYRDAKIAPARGMRVETGPIDHRYASS